MSRQVHTFCEFFAGGGMARLGLGGRWQCTFANEWCSKKADAYTKHFGVGDPSRCPELKVADVASLRTSDVPGWPDLVWASFPCQDLSLAGKGAGLQGERSGTFWPFWSLMDGLAGEGRAPGVIALENVLGAVTSHGGQDFAALFAALARSGYRAGPLVIDALRFVPQSRPRLFIVAVRADTAIPGELTCSWPSSSWHPKSLIEAWAKLPPQVRSSWVWWNLPDPPPRTVGFSSLVEEQPSGTRWHTEEETRTLLSLMSKLNRQKLRMAQASGVRRIGTVYRRTRPDENGGKTQRAEVRFDDVSGCLRTPSGGSSRQIVIFAEGNEVRSRLISPKEAARLMGVPEGYPIPDNYNDAYHLFGDGLVVPVVAWLSDSLLLRLRGRAAVVEAA